MLAKLVEEKTPKIAGEGRLAERSWRVFFLGFSRSGWTEEARQYQAALQKRPIKGENWQAVGMRLVDLAQLDRNLERRADPGGWQGKEIVL